MVSAGDRNTDAQARALAAAVDGGRLWRRHMDMAEIGAIGGGGVNRQALSQEDIAARALLIDWGRSLGLMPSVDAMANLFLRLEGRDPELPPLLLGSHMDSQPNGGRFDGIYGVLAALETLEAMVTAGMRPRRPLELVAWTNEEGSRFAPGSMGSMCFAGLAAPEDFKGVRDNDGVRLADALAATLSATPDLSRRDLGFPIAGFLEVHIEQGPQLERAGLPVGVVNGIQGSRLLEVEVKGESSHAGTTPRAARRDALQAASRLIVELDDTVRDDDDVLRFTIGRLLVFPNAPNSIPESVRFSIDIRHPEETRLEHYTRTTKAICEAHGGVCSVHLTEIAERQPCTFHPPTVRTLEAAAESLDIPYRTMSSGAFHDAQSLQAVAPAAMLFVPCRNGISHNPAEYAEPDDLAAGTHVLAAAASMLAV